MLRDSARHNEAEDSRKLEVSRSMDNATNIINKLKQRARNL